MQTRARNQPPNQIKKKKTMFRKGIINVNKELIYYFIYF